MPGRGQSESGEATVRPEVEPVVPALQSGSLFGSRTGVMVIDAQLLKASEAAAIIDLLEGPDSGSHLVVFLSAGKLPARLSAHLRKHGRSESFRKLQERQALQWIRQEARKRRLRLRADAAKALVERFGTDVEALGHALDQLALSKGPITGELIRDRFRNRPDQPIWRLTDAFARGSVEDALRTLHDLLTRSHPLLLLGAIENDLRRRALASTAPDIETFALWIRSKPDYYPTRRAWQAGSRMTDSTLSRAIEAVRRTDSTLKTLPEETHLVTMERLAVSLCYWYRN